VNRHSKLTQACKPSILSSIQEKEAERDAHGGNYSEDTVIST
jgi:hypothetical protein